MGANPVFRIFLFVQRLRVLSSSNLESRISGSLPNMWNHQMFQKSMFSTRARDHFSRDMDANPVFRTFFYLKSYDDEILYVGTLCDLEYECPNRISIFGLGSFFWREPRFSDFWFVQRLRVGLSARRRRVSIRSKAERFARRRRALCPGAKRLCYCPL